VKKMTLNLKNENVRIVIFGSDTTWERQGLKHKII
jgi:hypothetical protein